MINIRPTWLTAIQHASIRQKCLSSVQERNTPIRGNTGNAPSLSYPPRPLIVGAFISRYVTTWRSQGTPGPNAIGGGKPRRKENKNRNIQTIREAYITRRESKDRGGKYSVSPIPLFYFGSPFPFMRQRGREPPPDPLPSQTFPQNAFHTNSPQQITALITPDRTITPCRRVTPYSSRRAPLPYTTTAAALYSLPRPGISPHVPPSSSPPPPIHRAANGCPAQKTRACYRCSRPQQQTPRRERSLEAD